MRKNLELSFFLQCIEQQYESYLYYCIFVEVINFYTVVTDVEFGVVLLHELYNIYCWYTSKMKNKEQRNSDKLSLVTLNLQFM